MVLPDRTKQELTAERDKRAKTVQLDVLPIQHNSTGLYVGVCLELNCKPESQLRF